MKKLLVAMVMGVLMCLPFNTAFAHSHLSNTDPADGEVKNEVVSELNLYFDGKIMEGSFVDIIHNEIGKLDNIRFVIGDGKLTAIPEKPLSNGDYTVNWSIISADGHPLEGSYTFTIEGVVEEAVVEEDEANDETDRASNEESEEVANEVTQVTNEPVESNNTLIFIIIGVAVLLVAFGLVFFTKRKK